MAVTLSEKYFHENPNDELLITTNTLDRNELDSKLSAIQCGVSNDQENQVRGVRGQIEYMSIISTFPNMLFKWQAWTSLI